MGNCCYNRFTEHDANLSIDNNINNSEIKITPKGEIYYINNNSSNNESMSYNEEELGEDISIYDKIDYILFNKLELRRHNEYREKHHVPKLKLNKELISIAQNYAKTCAEKKSFKYSDRYNRMMNAHPQEWVGESIYYCENFNGPKYKTGQMTDEWYSQINYYDFKTGRPKDNEKVSHFTQIVWKDTREVGFGIAFNGNKCYTVANYYPGGNYNNGELRNVYPI